MSAPQNDAYVVIARRYRPQSFGELIGQEHVAKALTGAIEADRVGHAYLFTGARGVGKTSAARILAKALNCESGPTATPCNACEVCLSVASGDDVDVIEIDGASNRGIEEIRQLRQNVAVRASRVRFKIYIIDEVHMLTKEAFNALLKTLEEPPEHVKFIFATTEPHKLPITILSRCQRFDFAGIDVRAIEQRLAHIAETEGIALEPEAAAILARRAAGSMRDGQSLLEQLLAGCGDHVTVDAVTDLIGIAPAVRIGKMATALADRNAAEALRELDEAVADGTDVGMLLEQLHGFFRDAMITSVGCNDDQFRFALPSQSDQVHQIGQQLGPESLLAVLQILDHAIGRLRLGVDVRTLVEMALVRISRLEDLDAVADLIAELRGGGSDSKRPATPSPRSPAVAIKKNVPRPVERSAIDQRPTDPPTERQPAGHGGAIPQHQEELTGDPAEIASSLADELRMAERTLAARDDSSPQPHFQSRRERKREVGQRPFVQKAMELFGADPEKLTYIPRTPPE